MPRDALRAHVVTSLIFSLALGAIALVWEFPRFFLFLALVCVAAIAYMRLFAWVETRLEIFEAEVEEPVKVHRPRRKKKRAAAPAPATTAAAAAPGNGSTVPLPAPATPVTAVKP